MAMHPLAQGPSERPMMTSQLRSCSYALLVLASADLAACASQTPGAAPPEAAVGSHSICSKYGFTPDTEAFESCSTRLSRLIREHQKSEGRCEAVRQQLLRPTPTGTYSSGFGTASAEANAAYRLCLSEHPPPSVLLNLPDGRVVTCEQIEADLFCH